MLLSQHDQSYTDWSCHPATKQTALKSGLADEIRQMCYDRVKRYDEFGYLTLKNFEFRFDTKEYVDERYRGSLFYCFR